MHFASPVAAAIVVSLVLGGCVASTHAVTPSTLGRSSSTEAMLAVIDQAGPIDLETVASCDWAVDRSGLINLEHPTARAAKLVDGDEPIQVFFHVLRHPTHGVFIVDTGVERALRDAPEKAAIRGLVASVMHPEKMTFHAPLGEWLAQHPEPLRGVLLTHLHLDHVSGLPDVAANTPIYAGPGETADRAFMNLFVQGTLDRALEGKEAVQEWQYQADPTGRFSGVIDVFGDASVFALSVPGHTKGSTAYVVRTTKGPVLLTGDASHTRWGWEHDVEPGTFSGDVPASVESLKRLRTLAAEHPAMEVRLGHQR